MLGPTLVLSAALHDAYLRRARYGRAGCEPFELTFHILRAVTPPSAGPEARLAGFRFEGVVAVAAEATRWDREKAKFVPEPVDWVRALAAGEMEPVILGTAALNEPDAAERLAKGGESALWLAGTPADFESALVDDARTFVLFVAAGEAILPNGVNADIRLFAVARELHVFGAEGETSLARLVEAGEEWGAGWRAFWRRKARGEDISDPQFEWAVPVKDDLAG